MDERKALAWIIAAGILLRLIPVLLIATNSTYDALTDGDTWGYQTMGKAIMEGDFLFQGGDANKISFYRTPGYPAFLGILYFLGLPDLGIALVQAVLDAVSIYLIWRICKELFGERVGLVSAALYASSPLFISFSFKILTESLFTALFLGANWLYIAFVQKGGREGALLAGLAMGLGIIVRPVAIPLPLLYAAAAFLMKRDRVGIMLFLAASYMLAGGWVARNYFILGEPIFSTISDTTYLCWHGPEVVRDPGLDREKWGEFIEDHALDEPGACAAMDYGKIAAGKDNLTAMIMERPLNYARAVGMGGMLLFAPVTPNYAISTLGVEPPHFGDVLLERGFDLGGVVGILAGNVPYLTLFVLFAAYQLVVYGGAAYGVWNGRGNKAVISVAAFAAIVVAYLIIVGGPVNMYSGYRYRVMLEPFLIVMAGYGISAFLFKSYSQRGRKIS